MNHAWSSVQFARRAGMGASMSRPASSIFAALMAAILLAACGSKQEPEESAAAPAAEQPAAEENPFDKMLAEKKRQREEREARKQKEKDDPAQAMIDSLKSGDKVITTGGIHGVVAGITDEIIQLRVASVDGKGVKIEISRAAVASLQKEQGGE